jgi:energy-coupling factor transporter transmembrane protein EcfT
VASTFCWRLPLFLCSALTLKASILERENGLQPSYHPPLMHPVIRIVTFLIFTLFVAFGGYSQLIFSIVILGLFYGLAHSHFPWRTSWQMLKRMRWLFLSMLVVYFWFTPGKEVFSALENFSPSWQGIQVGCLRIGSLVMIVTAVNIIIKSTSTELMTGGLLWLLAPLRYVGLPYERLALRIVLTFNMISEIQYEFDLLKRAKSDERVVNNGEQQAASQKFFQRLDRLGVFGANLIGNILSRSQEIGSQPIELPAEPAPPVYQWILPFVLFAGFILVKFI